MTEYEAKLLEEIIKIRETLAAMAARESAALQRMDRLEEGQKEIRKICEVCPARLRSLSLTTVLKDAILVSGAVSGLLALGSVAMKLVGGTP